MEKDMNLPNELQYTATHEWIRRDADAVTVGISDHAQSELTDVVFVELPEMGRHLSPGNEMLALESVKAVAYVYAPLGGTIAAVNEKLRKQPELVNQDPYGEGWLVKLTPDEPEHAVVLLDAAAYEKKLREGD
jgi:glycine cleavage system H protein